MQLVPPDQSAVQSSSVGDCAKLVDKPQLKRKPMLVRFRHGSAPVVYGAVQTGLPLAWRSAGLNTSSMLRRPLAPVPAFAGLGPANVRIPPGVLSIPPNAILG